MIFSENNNDNEEILENHLQQEKAAGVKKYVISVKSQYIDLIDSMSIEERNDVINDIISEHNDYVNEKKQIKIFAKTALNVVILIFILLFAAPGALWLVNKSFTLTKNNYSEMQNNFEVLYKNKKINY